MQHEHPIRTRAWHAIGRHLAVDPVDLAADLRLREDLAMDPLETLDLVRAVEAATGIALAERAIAAVTTLGDLCDLVVARAVGDAGHEEPTPAVWVRIAQPGGTPRTDRRAHLTPYMAELLREEARLAGPGACIEAVLPPDAPEAAVARVERAVAGARRSGATVLVRRGTPAVAETPRPRAGAPDEPRTLAELSALVARVLHELQRERSLRELARVAPVAHRHGDVAAQRRATDHALADYATFADRVEPELPADVRRTLPRVRQTLTAIALARAAAPLATPAPAGAWSGAEEALLALTEAIACVTPDAGYGRMVKAVLALQRARVATTREGVGPAARGAHAGAGAVLSALREAAEAELAALRRRTAGARH